MVSHFPGTLFKTIDITPNNNVLLPLFHSPIFAITNLIISLSSEELRRSIMIKAYVFFKRPFCDCMFLSCHTRVSEWIYTVQLPGCQGTPCSKQTRNLKFKWLQWDSNPQTKWLSVDLRSKWLWVRGPLYTFQ